MASRQFFNRWVAESLAEKLKRPCVHLMFGARQTGKSTLLHSLLPPDTLRIDLSNPADRSRFLARPAEFAEMCLALQAERKDQYVFVDEAQAVPAIFDAVQHLYDGDKARWRFVLCGSSARRLRRTGANMLPGRSFMHRLFPLILPEQPAPLPRISHAVSPLPMSWPNQEKTRQIFPAWDLEERLSYGALPGIVTSPEKDRGELLKAYSVIYLEEEIRREALVKDWGAFVRFLQLAAMESGGISQFREYRPGSGGFPADGQILLPASRGHVHRLPNSCVLAKFAQKPALNAQVFLLRPGRAPRRSRPDAVPGAGEGKPGASVRTMGGHRAVETAPISRRRATLLFSNASRS